MEEANTHLIVGPEFKSKRGKKTINRGRSLGEGNSWCASSTTKRIPPRAELSHADHERTWTSLEWRTDKIHNIILLHFFVEVDEESG